MKDSGDPTIRTRQIMFSINRLMERQGMTYDQAWEHLKRCPDHAPLFAAMKQPQCLKKQFEAKYEAPKTPLHLG
jgi:hypothetical protein